MLATRKASDEVIQWAAEQVPELVGGSADLAPSTLTLIDDGGDVRPGCYAGRNLHFGIREHGMGAIVNGLYAARPARFGATFLIFSDYMKGVDPARGVDAASPSIFVFTHDSIGLGEDGPTHQPVEQLAALRAIPEPQHGAPGGSERDRARLAVRHRADRDVRPRSRSRARGCRRWNPAARARRRDRTRRVRAARGLDGPPGSDPDGDGLRGAPVRRGGRTSSRPRRSPRASCRCRAWTASPSRTRPTATRCCRPACARASPWRPRARSAGGAGSGDEGTCIGMTTFGASAPAKALYPHFGFTPRRWPSAARRRRASEGLRRDRHERRPHSRTSGSPR